MPADDNEDSSTGDFTNDAPAPSSDLDELNSDDAGWETSSAFDAVFGSTSITDTVFGSLSTIAADYSSANLTNSGLGAALGSLSSVMAEYSSAKLDTYGLGSLSTIAADSTFASIIASNYAAGATPGLALPHDVAAEAGARDFLQALHLALLAAQSQGRTGLKALVRIARSSPSKVAAVTLAVAMVYVLMQVHPDFKAFVGDLANAVEVVLFPLGVVAAVRLNKGK
jgi:hypothetical protein